MSGIVVDGHQYHQYCKSLFEDPRFLSRKKSLCEEGDEHHFRALEKTTSIVTPGSFLPEELKDQRSQKVLVGFLEKELLRLQGFLYSKKSREALDQKEFDGFRGNIEEKIKAIKDKMSSADTSLPLHNLWEVFCTVQSLYIIIAAARRFNALSKLDPPYDQLYLSASELKGSQSFCWGPLFKAASFRVASSQAVNESSHKAVFNKDSFMHYEEPSLHMQQDGTLLQPSTDIFSALHMEGRLERYLSRRCKQLVTCVAQWPYLVSYDEQDKSLLNTLVAGVTCVEVLKSTPGATLGSANRCPQIRAYALDADVIEAQQKALKTAADSVEKQYYGYASRIERSLAGSLGVLMMTCIIVCLESPNYYTLTLGIGLGCSTVFISLYPVFAYLEARTEQKQREINRCLRAVRTWGADSILQDSSLNRKELRATVYSIAAALAELDVALATFQKDRKQISVQDLASSISTCLINIDSAVWILTQQREAKVSVPTIVLAFFHQIILPRLGKLPMTFS